MNQDLNQEKREVSPWKWYLTFLIIGIVIGFLVTYQFKDQSAAIVSQGSELVPNFTSQDVFGNQVSLFDFRNKKPVLLIFWSTLCSYCHQELPNLKEFYQKHKNEVEIIAIDSGETKEVIKSYIEENNIEFLVLLDEQKEIWNEYLVSGSPFHFLISKKGEAVIALPGLTTIDDLEEVLLKVQ